MSEISSVAVFCGSRVGFDPAFADAARSLGRGLARFGIRLVYGGGRNGLMGVLSDAVLAEGGTVLGVIPDFLMRSEVAHPDVTDLVVTTNMHDRKRLMAEAADAFISLPGGLGTLDETLEIVTWRQLGLHDKPVYVCDVAGSAAAFVSLVEGAIARGFCGPEARGFFTLVHGVTELLDRLGTAHRGTGLAGTRV